MKKIFLLSTLVLGFWLISLPAYAMPDEGVFFENLEDGQTVSSPVHVIMGLKGKTLAPAGDPTEGLGHHHLIVDGGAVPEGSVIPADETHIHFGKAQTETSLELSPGEHSLTLQLADGLHRSYGPAWSKTIQITVE